MDENVKQKLSLVVTVVCIAVAIFVGYKTFSGGGAKVSASDSALWMKCFNKDCENTFQITNQEYADFMMTQNVVSNVPGYNCPECNKDSAFKARKCMECEFVFREREVLEEPKCPKCGSEDIQ